MANPSGQFEVLQAAEPVYRLLKAGKLDAKQMPPEESSWTASWLLHRPANTR